MIKFLSAMVVAAAACGAAAAQTPGTCAPENMGKAPTTENGVGRADVRVVDASGAPVPNAYVMLTSNRTDGFLCESWSGTNECGVAVLPPLHMGPELTFKVTLKGYKTMSMKATPSSLGEPVRITLARK